MSIYFVLENIKDGAYKATLLLIETTCILIKKILLLAHFLEE